MRLSTTLLCVLLSLSCNSNQNSGNTKTEASPPGGAGTKVAPSSGAGATSPATSATGAPGAQASASGGPTGSASPPASAASSASPAASRGLDAPGNHTEIVSMVKSVLKNCKWERETWKRPCASLNELESWFSPGHVVVQDTMIELCADSDPRVRALCSFVLEFDSLENIREKPLATTLLDAFEKERSTAACTGMARAIGHINAEKSGNEERIKQLIKSHPVARCRQGVLENLLASNEYLYDYVVNIARTDPSPALRSAAARGLGRVFLDDKRAQSCKVWLEMLDESGQEHTGQAASLLAEKEVCGGQWDELLKKVDAAVAAGKVVSPMEDVACQLPRQKKAKAEQKSQALALAKKLVENEKNPGPMRAKALECVGRYDPEGKAFAAKFADAPAAEVKKAAAKVAEQKP